MLLQQSWFVAWYPVKSVYLCLPLHLHLSWSYSLYLSLSLSFMKRYLVLAGGQVPVFVCVFVFVFAFVFVFVFVFVFHEKISCVGRWSSSSQTTSWEKPDSKPQLLVSHTFAFDLILIILIKDHFNRDKDKKNSIVRYKLLYSIRVTEATKRMQESWNLEYYIWEEKKFCIGFDFFIITEDDNSKYIMFNLLLIKSFLWWTPYGNSPLLKHP